MKYEFKVGDRVRIREWKDMVNEFGVSKLSGNISCGCVHFTKEMEHLCGRTGTVTDIQGLTVKLNFDNKSGNTNWVYSLEMIKPLLQEDENAVKRNGNKEEIRMKNEFKVGDRVRIREWDDMKKEYGLDCFGGINCLFSFVKGMAHLCGRTATLTDINETSVRLKFDTPVENGWSYSTDMIEPLFPNDKITIERYDNKVIAKWGKRTGVAKCHPEDKFDFATGATLAFDRLMQSENVTRKLIDDALDRVRDELYGTHGIKKNK